MPYFLRQIFVLVFILILGRRAPGEGLVQLSLSGALSAPGGALVEVAWETAEKGEEPKRVELFLHLAQGTSALDLAHLLAIHFKGKGVDGIFPAPAANGPAAAQLFVPSTTRLRLRLAPGLTGKITTCDSAPTKVKLLRPEIFPGKAILSIRTTTLVPRTRKIGSVFLSESFLGDATPESVCKALFKTGLESGLTVDRPTQDSWRPIRGEGGSTVIGCSVTLASPNADWGLEVSLSAPLR